MPIAFEGIDELDAELAALEAAGASLAVPAERANERLRAEVVKVTPVRTGRLRRSIRVDRDRLIADDVFYAAHVERLKPFFRPTVERYGMQFLEEEVEIHLREALDSGWRG